MLNRHSPGKTDLIESFIKSSDPFDSRRAPLCVDRTSQIAIVPRMYSLSQVSVATK